MSDQTQDQPRRLRPATLTMLQQAYDASVTVHVERDNLKADLAERDHQLQMAERRATISETECEQLRAALDRAKAERDGYFQDTITLRTQIMSIGAAVTEAVKSIATRQAFSPPSAPIEEQAEELPQFVRHDQRKFDGGPRRPIVDMDRLSAALVTRQ
jgi:hypothetical protein